MSIEHLVDIDGRFLRKDLDFYGDAEEETIPESLQDMVESGVEENEENEGYQGNVSR